MALNLIKVKLTDGKTVLVGIGHIILVEVAAGGAQVLLQGGKVLTSSDTPTIIEERANRRPPDGM